MLTWPSCSDGKITGFTRAQRLAVLTGLKAPGRMPLTLRSGRTTATPCATSHCRCQVHGGNAKGAIGAAVARATLFGSHCICALPGLVVCARCAMDHTDSMSDRMCCKPPHCKSEAPAHLRDVKLRLLPVRRCAPASTCFAVFSGCTAASMWKSVCSLARSRGAAASSRTVRMLVSPADVVTESSVMESDLIDETKAMAGAMVAEVLLCQHN